MLFRQRAESLTVHAPAKLNLFLEILGRRPDGFHEIETLVVTVDWYDSLTFTDSQFTESRFTEEFTEDVRLHCHSTAAARTAAAGGPTRQESIPSGDENLVVRAAKLLREHRQVERGVRIDLVKRIPAEAGLGGGSSDAAATLAGLNRLWRLGLSTGELAELGAELGSDVPCFLSTSPAVLCRGRGELLEPLPVRLPLHFVVARPPSGCATAEMYRRCRVPDGPESVERLRDALQRGRPADVARLLHNRLRTPAMETNEDVRVLASRFDRQSVLGHDMSGSGSSWFGLCSSARHARSIARRLRADGRTRVVACRASS